MASEVDRAAIRRECTASTGTTAGHGGDSSTDCPHGHGEPRLGHTRIQGALANLDHEVGRGIIANILRAQGLEPAPERMKKTAWTEFLKTDWDALAAADFFTADV